jgi:hypothetical protein
MPVKGVVKSFRLDDRNVHPTIRFDSFLRTHDGTFKTNKREVEDDGSYVRTFPLYGSMRPSPAFTGVSRVQPFKGPASAYDMSNLPPTWNDMRGDKREGSYSYNVVSDCDPEFFKILGNHSLMLPSERREEALRFKGGRELFDKARKEYSEYTKKRRILTRHHKSGVVGVDGPMKSDSEMFAYDAARVGMHRQQKDGFDAERREYLGQKTRSSDAVAHRGYDEEPSMDSHACVPLQRKRVDPEVHPFRFLNTHERVFPKAVPTFDPVRARVLHHHEVRHKNHDILHHGSNTIHGIRQRWVDDGSDPGPTAAELGIGIGWRTD